MIKFVVRDEKIKEQLVEASRHFYQSDELIFNVLMIDLLANLHKTPNLIQIDPKSSTDIKFIVSTEDIKRSLLNASVFYMYCSDIDENIPMVKILINLRNNLKLIEIDPNLGKS